MITHYEINPDGKIFRAYNNLSSADVVDLVGAIEEERHGNVMVAVAEVGEIPADICDPVLIDSAWTEGASQQERNDRLTTYKEKKEKEIDREESRYRNQVFGNIDAYRVFEYMIGVMEAYFLKADDADADDMPHVKGASKKVNARKAEERGTTEADEAALVKNVYGQWLEITARTGGIRVKNKDALLAATTLSGVDAAVAQYHQDMQTYLAELG